MENYKKEKDLPVVFLALANDETNHLRELKTELKKIRKALETIENILCKVVFEPNASIETIFDVFQKYGDRIAIFHYAGHADSFELLLENAKGENLPAFASGLNSFLAGHPSLSLVFLNGCCTQKQAQDLIQAGVPAVIGTSNHIEDLVAAQLAERFYLGLANGHSLSRAWKEAEDEIFTRYDKNQQGIYRILYRKKLKNLPDRFPWELYIQEGSEIIEEWNLADAADDPLFGLPKSPKYSLGDKPFRFLERYRKEHTQLFFGRARDIRDLYDRATNIRSSNVIFLHGQSGVGKSSLLEAGLLPRLEKSVHVIYIRRDQSLGLTETLLKALNEFAKEISEFTLVAESQIKSEETHILFKKNLKELLELGQEIDEESKDEFTRLIEKIESFIPKSKSNILPQRDAHITQKKEIEIATPLQIWKKIENTGYADFTQKKPLVIILDQVEEVYSLPNEKLKNELEDFLREVSLIFGDARKSPKGKLILSYRKERHPEIDAISKKLKIPREPVFIKHLDEKGIIEVVNGIFHDEYLQQRYRLVIKPNLPETIASDLLADKDSPIAPVLQILLTKMWNEVEKDIPRIFSLELYNELKKKGILMGDFLNQQLEKVNKWNSSIYNTGLVLDILFRHTTDLGTASSNSNSEIIDRYPKQKEFLPELIQELKKQYLLTDSGEESTALAHDTLAPLVQQRFKNSNYPGQRASHILENKKREFENNPKTIIDEADLAIVEAGELGMPKWDDLEESLINNSRAKRERTKLFKKNLNRAGILAIILILIGAGTSINSSIKANAAAEIATENQIKAENATELAKEKECEAQESEKRALAYADSANRATERALLSEQIAISKTQEALHSAKIAKEEKSKSDSLRNKSDSLRNVSETIATLSLAKALANKSLRLKRNESEIKSLLAAYAYAFHTKEHGEKFDDDIYNALYNALKSQSDTPDKFKILNPNSEHEQIIRKVQNDGKGGGIYSINSEGILNHYVEGIPILEDTSRLKNYIHKTLAVSSDGKYLIRFTEDKPSLSVFIQKNGDPLADSIVTDIGMVKDLIFSPDNRGFYSIGVSKKLTFYDINLEKNFEIDSVIYDVEKLAISPDGKQLVGASAKGELIVWDVSNPRVRSYSKRLKIIEDSIEIDAGSISAISISKTLNKPYIAIGNNRGEVWLGEFDPSTIVNEIVCKKLRGSTSRISSIDFGRNDTLLAVASFDNTIHIWNLHKINDLPIVLHDHSSWVTSMVFNKDGTVIYAGCQSGEIKVWPIHISVLFNELCQRLEENQITKKQWDQYMGPNIEFDENKDIIRQYCDNGELADLRN